MRFALKLFYEGSGFHGFQRQPNVSTIEEVLLASLKKCSYFKDFKQAGFSYASRTDVGVSALSQVVAFNSVQDPNIRRINSVLPEGIFFWAKAKVSDGFNPRRDLLFKVYRYYEPYEGQDVKRINEALRRLEGEHNFKKLSKPEKNRGTVCCLDKINLNLKDDLLIYEFIGKSFLWKMIRKIVSLLKLIGSGLLETEVVDRILDPQDNFDPKLKPAGAEGLVLYDIHYPFAFNEDNYSLKRIRDYLEAAEKSHRVKHYLNKDLLLRLICP